jgi:localization factor PodJL
VIFDVQTGLESVMKPGIPWSVKGVEPELREIAKTAARRSGMTLGEWLNSAINEQADAPEIDSPVVAAKTIGRSRISTHPIERAATRLEDIAEQLSRLARRETETAPHPVQMPHQDTELLTRVLSRVDSNERQTVEAFTAINERLATMSRQVTQSVRSQPKPEEQPGFQALEKAVRNIVEHLEVSEKRTRDNMKSLQERMGDMASKATGSVQAAPAFSQLENRLTDLAKRIDSAHNQPSPALPDLLRSELNELASRIETVRDSAEALASKAQTQAVQASQAELRTIEERILGLLREAQTSFVASSGSPAEIQKFRGEIERLNARIDEAADNREVSALRVAVEQLSTRVAQPQDPRPLADMDRRIIEITKRIEQGQAQSREMPQFNDLERRMAELDQRLNSAIKSQDHGPSQEALESKLAEVSDRLGRTEHQLSHLETIEQAISQLYGAMEQNRNHAQQVAEEAANRVGQHFMSQPQAAVSLAQSPEIQALEHGLHAVREASQIADSRNQETLEAVHETLEQIVAKLSELETAAIGQRVSQAAAPAEAMVQQAVYETAFDVSPAAPEQYSFEVPPPAIEPDTVLEATPNEPVAANPFEAPLTGNPTEDYIAAARRMHQASMQQKSILSSVSPGMAKMSEEHSKKLLSFKLPFMKGKPEMPSVLAGDMRLPPDIKPANNNTRTKKTNLILMGLAVLALVSGVMAKSFFGGAAPVAQMEEPTAIVQPMEAQPTEKPVETAPVAPAAEAQPTTPQAAPLEPAVPSAAQQGMNDDQGSDDILTGSLPAGKSAITMPNEVALEESIGTPKLREAARMGDPNAQFVVATRYLNGENVTTDFGKAAYWYGKAAASGSAPAQYRVATLFERGKGVEKDIKSAQVWYERAGALGNVKAMHNAAVIAAGNENGGPDYARAFKWFSLAASHGLKDSQFNLAVLIERGLGTKADPSEALFWYSAAAAQQDADAQTHVDTLTKSLSPATVAAVKLRLQKWTPDKAPDAANVVAIEDSAWRGVSQKIQQSALDPVSKAQGLLGKLGFNIGDADGKMGGRTANAIRLFQLQEGMKVTGQVTPELLDLMQAKAA